MQNGHSKEIRKLMSQGLVLRRCITFCKECKLYSRWHWLRCMWNDQWSWWITWALIVHKRSVEETIRFKGKQNPAFPVIWAVFRSMLSIHQGIMQFCCPKWVHKGSTVASQRCLGSKPWPWSSHWALLAVYGICHTLLYYHAASLTHVNKWVPPNLTRQGR